MESPYTVINASAGSGKTYTLVQRLLMICLKYPAQHTTIRNILALTFTNKAANEMKERILSWLGKFASDQYENNADLIGIHQELENQGIHVTLQDLHERSKKLLDYILHHYSILNIGTIDKFNSRLVRSFSYELGLAKNFNLEIQSEPFLIEAVDQMLDKIGDDEDLSETLMDYVNYGLDNEKRTNLNKTLYDSAKRFVNDIHYEHLKNNQNFNEEHYRNSTLKLRNEIKKLQQESVSLAEKSLMLIQKQGLENADFAGGGKVCIQYFFDGFLRTGEPKLFDCEEDELKRIEKYREGASKKGKVKEHLIFEILDQLIENRQKIIENFIAVQKKKKILSALLPLKVHQDIQKELNEIEEENDVVLLSKFNILIHENLKNEPSEFIYEKVGTQFQHYFFDEFQDTSLLQWQNLLPLRNHSLSAEGTSFTLVGDPKQSIYRFRGGDSQLMMDIINHNEETPHPAKVINLKENWRSAKNIVRFNNELYQFISKNLKEEHRDIFGKDAWQTAKSEMTGRVKVHLIENDIKDTFYQDTALKMQQDIQECLNHGFSFSDITILCRNNLDIFNYSQKLGSIKVTKDGMETNIKTISESGLTLDISHTLNAVVHFLRWEATPNNHQFLVMMMYYLNVLGRIEIKDFTAEILNILTLSSRAEMISYIAERYRLKLIQDGMPRLNLYNYVEFFVKEFSVEKKETDFVFNFLEILYGFTQNSGAGMKDFIRFWDEEAHKKTIQASENIDAVQIMTIHKAKGLEFPVVLLSMENKTKDSAFTEWFATQEITGVSSVNMDQFGGNLGIYDGEIQNFNEANSYRNCIDRLCLQYVATTRPVEQLILYIQKPKKTNYLEIYDFITENNTSGSDEFDFFDTDSEILLKKSEKKKQAFRTEQIKSFNKGIPAKSSVKIATPSRNYQHRNENVRKGIFLHEILSKINTAKEVEKVLGKYVLDGVITREEEAELRHSVLSIMAKYPDYFDENLQVMNEREIMINENGITEIYRPDRILNTKNGYIIIDFKTGKAEPKHQKQIEMYTAVLEKLDRKVISANLIYL